MFHVNFSFIKSNGDIVKSKCFEFYLVKLLVGFNRLKFVTQLRYVLNFSIIPTVVWFLLGIFSFKSKFKSNF